MKISRIALAGLVIALLIATPAFGWVTGPTEETGYYFGYDDTEEGPPFAWPQLPQMPTYYPIWNNPDAYQIWYETRPYSYELCDSFWFFGKWYEPGTHLYNSWDGWVSFDESSADGFPVPPDVEPPFPSIDDPNEIISPLWQDYDPTLTPDPADDNRLYILSDDESRTLSIEWHNMKHAATENVYDFMLTLQYGGQELLMTDDCGVLYSNHLIHFLYNTSSAGWDADEGATGIEDHTGEYGITYGGEIVDGRVIRMGHRRTLDTDYAATAIISPTSVVDPGSPVEPKVVLGNIGKTVNHINSIFNIYDDAGTVIYQQVLGFYEDILPGKTDTFLLPYWTPGDSGEYYIVEFFVSLDGDQCPANDTLIKHVWSGAAIVETPVKADFELNVNGQTVKFSIPYSINTEIAVYDVNGRKVKALTDKVYPAGAHTLTWDYCDDAGHDVSQGIYLVRIQADGWKDVKKVVFLN